MGTGRRTNTVTLLRSNPPVGVAPPAIAVPAPARSDLQKSFTCTPVGTKPSPPLYTDPASGGPPQSKLSSPAGS